MIFEALKQARIEAMKAHQSVRKNAITGMIDACQKATLTLNGKVEMTDELAKSTLIKYQKNIEEMIATCPAERKDLLVQYYEELGVVKEFAPQLITDKEVLETRVKEIAGTAGIELVKSNQGALMKQVAAQLKGIADMKVISAIVKELLE